MVGVDQFSKWPVASVVGGVNAKIAVKFMEDYIPTYGTPKKIITRQGTAFTGKEFRKFCGKLNIELKFGTPNLHTRTGLVERTIGSLKSCNTQKCRTKRICEKSLR